MATMVKSFFKGFKHFFVVKEHEMVIGYPTDVKHVAHIGWESSSTTAPSWMKEFHSDFSAASFGDFEQSREQSWVSQDFNQSRGLQPSIALNTDRQPKADTNVHDAPKASKRTRRKKSKVSSPSSSKPSKRSPKSRSSSYATAIEEASHSQDQLRGV